MNAETALPDAGRLKEPRQGWLGANAEGLVVAGSLLLAVICGAAAWWIWNGESIQWGDRRLVAAVLTLLSASALVFVIWHDRLFVAAIVATGPAVPTLASATALAFCLAWKQDSTAFALGTVVVFPTWLLAALIFRRSASVDRASPSNYDALQQRITQAKAQYAALCTDDSRQLPLDGRSACKEVAYQLDEIDRGIGPEKKDTRWLTGVGYNNLWSQIHRVEEALSVVEPEGTAIGGAIADVQRLDGSALANKRMLLRNLRQAITDVQPPAMRYLSDSIVGNPDTGERAPVGDVVSTADNGFSAAGGGQPRADANGETVTLTAVRMAPAGADVTQSEQRRSEARAV